MKAAEAIRHDAQACSLAAVSSAAGSGAAAAARFARPRVLVISHVGDERDGNGGHVYTRNLIDMLDGAFESVRVIYIYPHAPRARRTRIVMSFVRAALTGRAAKIEYFSRRAARMRITHIVTEFDPDLVVFDHLESVLYAPQSGHRAARLLVQHNDEAALYAQRIAQLKPRWLRGLLGAEVKRLACFQVQAFETCGHVLFSSDEAVHGALSAALTSRFTLAPAFDYPPVEARPGQDGLVHLLFVGNMNWWPNVDAVNGFLDDVWPSLGAEFRLHLVGRNSERWRGRDARIVAHGFVTSRDDAWCRGAIFIAPIRTGVSVNVKVAEALYNARAMIATPLALSGLPIAVDPAIAVLASAADWRAFLVDTARVREFARRRPLESTRAPFCRDYMQARLAEYLVRVTADGTARRAQEER